MLHRLTVREFLLLHDVDLDVGPGLTVITGETGSGKTSLSKALAGVLGEQVHASSGWVEAALTRPPDLHDLSEVDDPESEDLVVARRFGSPRRALAWGRTTRREAIAHVCAQAVTMTSQHAARQLTSARAQLALVDEASARADDDHGAATEAVAHAYERLVEAQQAFDQWQRQARERTRLIDDATADLAEIEDVAPTPGEDHQVEAAHDVAVHAHELAEARERIGELVHGPSGAITALDEARRIAEGVARIDARYAEVALVIEQGVTVLADASVPEAPEADVDVDALAGRLGALRRLMRRYGPEIDDVLAHAQTCREHLAAWQDPGHEQRLQEALADAQTAYDTAAEALGLLRRRRASQLLHDAVEHLRRLGMADARLTARWTTAADGPRGRDAVELLVALNAGHEGGTLRQVASGGEMSRLYLALLLAAGVSTPTVVFDEVDAGIGGGAVAQALADELVALAADRQVLVITHLPQIAAAGDHHWLVRKETRDEQAVADVRVLDMDARREEIARMLGSTDDDGLRLAEGMLRATTRP